MKRVLIIDDDCFNEEDSIRAGFEGTGIEIFLCSNKDDALKLLKGKMLFDCIVLDWFLEGDDSSLSQLVLKELNNKYFSPVLIYSSFSEDFRQIRDAGEITFPDNLIHEVDKGNFSNIKEVVEDWLKSNTTAKLSSLYLTEVYDKIHETFWSLNDIEHGNIAAVYKKIILENGTIHWENDFIINILFQAVTTSISFRQSLQLLIEKVQIAHLETNLDGRRRIINKILYYQSSPEFLSNGDLIRLDMNGDSCYGLITTPDCDLANGNTRYIEFIELVKYNSVPLGNSNNTINEGKSGNHFFLPAVLVDENLIDLVAVFKATHFVLAKDNRGRRYPEVSNRIKYLDTFVYKNVDCTMKYISSLVNPYKSELFHKRNTHASRVGIPNIYEYLK